MSMTVEYNTVFHDRMVHAVGWILGVFYVNYGLLWSRYLEWIQGALNVIIFLFLRIGLMANVAESKMMTCQPGTIQSRILEEAVGW